MKHAMKQLFAGLLALCMLFSAVPMVSAADSTQPAPAYADEDSVRVSIVLDAPSALEQYAGTGVAAKEIASDADALAYQESLRTVQDAVAAVISREVLNGQPLDVVWNLTLVSNTISANVPYGAIDAIKQIPGVSDVLLEPFFQAEEMAVNAASSSAGTYAAQLGTEAVYQMGYKGAGMRIAILDTGIDPDHQSFDGRALAYALKEDYGEDYAKTLNLLTVDEIRSKWSQLHASENAGFGAEGVDALYYSEKLPFNFNYPEHVADGSHDNDRAGSHGSHVAGIAGANRYVYLNKEDATPVSAAEQVLVQGVAPDAQLLAMKIIGNNGGAYPSDQFAAIEDSLVLGADAINMSIGTDWAGFSYSTEYQSVLDRLEQTDAVVVISAGNYGSYIDNGGTTDLLRIEDVNMNTICDPGSFSNAFTIASSDSAIQVGVYFTVNGTDRKLFYYDSTTSAALSTLAGDTAYPYVYLDSVGMVGAPEAVSETESVILENQLQILNNAVPGGLAGKVVFMNRGTTTFSEKADAAAELGAIAVVVVNNEPNSVSADTSTYQHVDVPVVTLDLADREHLMENTTEGTITAQYDAAGNPAPNAVLHYYTGTVTIAASYAAEGSDADSVMSDFSAWGVPGSLELKPEITAPGGNIFSVDGSSADGKGYKTLSGTSMATAQVSGLAALVIQYAKDNNLKEKTGLTYRALAQSLLMSTALPMHEESGSYVPVLQQGAGLANAANAVTATSYITVAGQPDGKVKVELKDDPSRTGRYNAVFTIHNLTDKAQAYTVSADLFTQAIETQDGVDYLSTRTTALEANVSVNGRGNNAVITVPASGEATVSVAMYLTDSQKAALNANYPNGAYIQAFLYAAPTVDGVTHSIPVLGFYGNWTDPSMFDSGYCPKAYSYGGFSGLTLTATSESARDRLLASPYGDAEEYLPARNAFDPSISLLSDCYFSATRNYAKSKVVIRNAQTNEVYMENVLGSGYALYYNDDSNYWGNNSASLSLDWNGQDKDGNLLPEGTVLTVELTLAPEYYLTGDGTDVDWNALGKGATISTTVTIDYASPTLLDVDDSTLDDGYITVTVQDNQYIGMAALYRMSAMDDEDDALSLVIVDDQAQAGTAVQVKLPLDQTTVQGEDLVLKVGDYAGHVAAYPLDGMEAAMAAMVSPDVVMRGDRATAQVQEDQAAELLDQVRKNGSSRVIVVPQISAEDNIPAIDISIPCTLVDSLKAAGITNIRILTPLGNVSIPSAAFTALGGGQGAVWVSLEIAADTIHLELSANGTPLDEVPGGIQLQVPREFYLPTIAAAMRSAEDKIKIIPTSASDPIANRIVFTVPGTATVYFLNNAKTFSDVPEGTWYTEGVQFAASHELVSGIGDNKFDPDGNITRASIATLLYRLEWNPETGLNNPFGDVVAGSWYADAVAWAAAHDIIHGDSAGNFQPGVDLTREQLAVFLYNYAKQSGMDVSANGGLEGYTDRSKVSSWALPAMEWAVSNGLIHGVGGNQLLPGGTATRAEVAVLMMHYIQFLAGIPLD